MTAVRVGADVRSFVQSEGAWWWPAKLGIGHSIMRNILAPRLDELSLVEADGWDGVEAMGTHHGQNVKCYVLCDA